MAAVPGLLKRPLANPLASGVAKRQHCDGENQPASGDLVFEGGPKRLDEGSSQATANRVEPTREPAGAPEAAVGTAAAEADGGAAHVDPAAHNGAQGGAEAGEDYDAATAAAASDVLADAALWLFGIPSLPSHMSREASQDEADE
eukprot:5488359-Prymnesium_polylepis.1